MSFFQKIYALVEHGRSKINFSKKKTLFVEIILKNNLKKRDKV